MRPGEWSRSRFWLGHFLNARHRRPAVAWAQPAPGATTLIDNAVTWLGTVTGRTGLARAWVMRRAAERHAADPAFVQCLRLVVREQHHHRDLAAKLQARFDRTPPAPAAVSADGLKPLGVRFRLSLQLLSDLADLATLEQVAATDDDAAMSVACTTILRERQMHVAFLAERLAAEFADFHFVRRNLRRWRVRAMFAGLLAARLIEQRGVLRALDVSPHAWVAQTWRHFEAVLERIVPYRRAELLRLLTSQRERPFDRPS